MEQTEFGGEFHCHLDQNGSKTKGSRQIRTSMQGMSEIPEIVQICVESNRISFSTASITALTRLLFVAIDTTSHKELLDMEVCHNSNKGVNHYTSSYRTQ